jgi:lipid-binding SYLF domain-containing protein
MKGATMKGSTIVRIAVLSLPLVACSKAQPVAAAAETSAGSTTEEAAAAQPDLPPETADLKRRADEAVALLRKTMPAVEPYFEKSVGYVVFPKITKGGLIVGGAHGNGVVYEGGRLIGTSSLSAGSIGLQAGGQEYSEVIFFESSLALVKFKQGKISLGAKASGVFADEGATAATRYHEGYAAVVFGESGLMGDASVGGQKLGFQPLK